MFFIAIVRQFSINLKNRHMCSVLSPVKSGLQTRRTNATKEDERGGMESEGVGGREREKEREELIK
jgi:hypothetical protein